jgi:mannose-1-phosphate guanylyltransferase
LIRRYLKETFNVLSDVAVASEESIDEILDRKYRQIEGVSVDYGIMENA